MESWMPVVGFEAFYEVSDLGRVRRTVPGKKSWPGKILTPVLSKHQYETVVLWGASCFHKRRYIHHLVMDAFVETRAVGMGVNDWQVNHKDGNKRNNSLENLEYVTHRENKRHAARLGLSPQGERNARAKLSESEVMDIRNLGGIMPRRAIAARFGVSYSAVECVEKRRYWAHL